MVTTRSEETREKGGVARLGVGLPEVKKYGFKKIKSKKL